jgi:dihydrofolate reductase
MAGRTIWHMTMSLDGFMADDRGTLEWMPTDAGAVPIGIALVPTIGAILAGRRAYDGGIARPGLRPYGGAYAGPVFVLSHRDPPEHAEPGFHFVTTGLRDGLDQARRAAGPANVVIFGASLGQQCLAAGELDEVLVHIAPVLIGSGLPAFAETGSGHQSFDVLERSGAEDMTTLRLAPRSRRPA